ncbi:hypothetical protein [Calothrix sp. PCC 7507]|uniref:hypothetical protein n=1 Tax=Calothrix sp. PCC 7507 TaxID=99598 RepID=UPI00029F2C6D|nr:hypothetical protein [Calothrix sp. PCC 7507]AFY36092.1 hypothetical protein Cal7507_5772 [Calothrix sp. PCC 7507]
MNNSCLKKIVLATIISIISLSCDAKLARNTQQTNANATEKPQPEAEIDYGDLIIKAQSDYLMIPVNLTEPRKKDETNFNLSRYDTKYGKLSNIIFYHKPDGDTHLLLNKKAIINSFDLVETKSAGKPNTRFWLYRILDQDTNGDKKLNERDAIIGYLSDLSGKNLQQITPNNTQIINWVVVSSQNAIFLKIIKDSDNDKKFTEKDQTNFVRVNLDKPEIGTEIISDQLEQEVKKTTFDGTQN